MLGSGLILEGGLGADGPDQVGGGFVFGAAGGGDLHDRAGARFVGQGGCDLLDLREVGEPLGDGLGGVGFGVGQVDDDEQRGVGSDAEAVGEQVEGDAWRRSFGSVAGVGPPGAQAERGDGEHEEERDPDRESRPRPAGDGSCPPGAPRRGGVGVDFGSDLHERGAEPVDVGADQAEHGGQEGDGDEHGDRDGDRDRDAHAGDQRDADQGEAEHRDHDGDAGEDDRAARGVDGQADGLCGFEAVGEVLSVAGDDEQGVVDADRDPDHRRHGRGDGDDVHAGGEEPDEEQSDADTEDRAEQRGDHGDDGAERHEQDDHGDDQPDDLRGPCLFGLCPLDDLAAVADLDAGRTGRVGGGEQRFELILGHRSGAGVVDDLGVGDGPVRRLEQRGGGPEGVDDLVDVVEGRDARRGSRVIAAWLAGSSIWPSLVANTATARPPAWSGKRCSSWSRACCDGVPGTSRLSVVASPNPMDSAAITAMAISHPAMTRHGWVAENRPRRYSREFTCAARRGGQADARSRLMLRQRREFTGLFGPGDGAEVVDDAGRDAVVALGDGVGDGGPGALDDEVGEEVVGDDGGHAGDVAGLLVGRGGRRWCRRGRAARR